MNFLSGDPYGQELGINNGYQVKSDILDDYLENIEENLAPRSRNYRQNPNMTERSQKRNTSVTQT